MNAPHITDEELNSNTNPERRIYVALRYASTVQRGETYLVLLQSLLALHLRDECAQLRLCHASITATAAEVSHVGQVHGQLLGLMMNIPTRNESTRAQSAMTMACSRVPCVSGEK
jgi:hypothetical protein